MADDLIERLNNYEGVCGACRAYREPAIYAEAATALSTRNDEIAALREALEPFARYAEAIGYMGGPSGLFDLQLESHEIGIRKITEEDFRRAQAALKDAQ